MRPLTLSDVTQLTDLMNRFERHWELPMVTTASQVEDDLTEPHIDLGSDSRGLWSNGELIGYGIVNHRPSGARLEKAHMSGLVDPGRTGEGHGRRILSWQLERAGSTLQSSDPNLPWYARAAEWDWIEPSHRLHRRFGLEQVRYIKDMLMSLDGPIDVSSPSDVDIVAWDRQRDEDARKVFNDAFADHWGSTPTDSKAFQHRLSSDGTRPDLSFLALAGDDVVGVCLNAIFPEDEASTGRKEGWIEALGVQRAWRGRGVATALIGESLAAFARTGMTHGAIGVDADNPTGAFHLYRRIGFEVTHGLVISQLEVPHP